MNKFRKLNLVKGLQTLFKTFWYAQVILFPCLLILVVVSMTSESRNYRWPVKFDQYQIEKISLNNDQGVVSSPVIETTHGQISFEGKNEWRNILITISGLIMVMIKSLWITFLFWKLIRSFMSNDPFLRINLKRIRSIGFVLIGFTVVELIFSIFYSSYLNHTFSGIHFSFDFNFRQLIFGLLVLVIGTVFEIGISYREENELTI